MANLTPTEVQTLIGKLKTFSYLVNAGTTSLGPLAAPPAVAADVSTKDLTLYETQEEVQASILTRNELTVTIQTRDVATALSLQAAFAKGDNVLDSAKKVTLTMVPITAATEQTITFSNAFLKPGLNFTPGENADPNYIELVFQCKSDPTTGKPFSFS